MSADSQAATIDAPLVAIPRVGRSGAHILAAAAAFVVTAFLANDPVSAWELNAFRFINDLPRTIEPVLYVIQQGASAVVIPIAAVVLWRITRRWRPALFLTGGAFFLGWLAAKILKAIVDRGRPGGMIPDVTLGFDIPRTGFGYPSGHAVLAFTLATVFSPFLPKRWRWTAYAAAVLIGLTRIYVGAHWPLDIASGAAYGIIVGTIINRVGKVHLAPSNV
ncbi:MAG: phosphatase PAP2 family protein [Acidimicrobiia bacterium]